MKISLVIVGYSGHALVVCDAARLSGMHLAGYMDDEQKQYNPYGITYLGSDRDAETLVRYMACSFFPAVGDNTIRGRILKRMLEQSCQVGTIIHPSAVVGPFTSIGEGSFLGAGAIINAAARIGSGVICNTGCIIEHECIVGDYAHIAPGAVLAGNVIVGSAAFVGANTVVKQGIKIGAHATIGAGAVIIRDVANHATIIGNPGHSIQTKKKL